MAAGCGGTDVSTAGDLRCAERWELDSACMTPYGPVTLSACSVASMTNLGCGSANKKAVKWRRWLFSVDVQVCSEGLESLETLDRNLGV